ncbi:unnamed protein product, partial [Rotaria magnacalcarata]
KTLNLFKEIFGENHSDIAMCLNNMACIYASEKRYSEALECHHKALIIKKSHLPDDHFDFSATHNNLAIVYDYMSQFDLALEHFNVSLTIKSKSTFINQLDTALTLKNIDLIYEMKEDVLQAKSFYKRAAVIRHHILSATHCDVIQIERDINRISIKIK